MDVDYLDIENEPGIGAEFYGKYRRKKKQIRKKNPVPKNFGIKNFNIVSAIYEKKMTQVEVAHAARLSSEARLARIIRQRVFPKVGEIARICEILGRTKEELSLKTAEEEKHE